MASIHAHRVSDGARVNVVEYSACEGRLIGLSLSLWLVRAGDNMDFDEVMRILEGFHREGVDYALIGGLALNFHGIARATEDVDIFLRPTPDNVQRLLKALKGLYDDPNIGDIDPDELLGEYPAVRYCPPNTDLYLDILTKIGEFAAYHDLDIVEIDIDGVKVKLVTPQSLFRLKKGTIRQRDRIDAQQIKEKFGLEDG